MIIQAGAVRRLAQGSTLQRGANVVIGRAQQGNNQRRVRSAARLTESLWTQSSSARAALNTSAAPASAFFFAARMPIAPFAREIVTISSIRTSAPFVLLNLDVGPLEDDDGG